MLLEPKLETHFKRQNSYLVYSLNVTSIERRFDFSVVRLSYKNKVEKGVKFKKLLIFCKTNIFLVKKTIASSRGNADARKKMPPLS